MSKSNRIDLDRGVWIALIASTIGLTFVCLRMAWQPILADEWDFYRSMTNWLTYRALIPHSQAYMHFTQLNFLIFDTSIDSARLVGVFSAIVSVWLIPILIHYAWPNHPQRNRLTVVAIILTVINPMTQQNAMLLDIDNTLLIPATMISIIVWAATQNASTRKRIIVALFYLLVYLRAWGYPRYQALIVPLISTLVAALVVPHTLNLPKSIVRGLIALGAFLFALNLWLLPDWLYSIYQVTFEGDLYDVSHRLLTGLKVVAEIGAPIGLLIIAGSIYAWKQKLDGGAVRLHLLSVLTVVSLATVSITQVTADYSTCYRYIYNYADYS